MASMRDIKRRKTSIQSTQQITKAMKLVSTVKLQKARVRAEKTKPYCEYMFKTVASILKSAGDDIDHPFLNAGESKKKAIITITSNRGLAGGYNSNITKLIIGAGFDKEDVQIYSAGRKGRDTLSKKGFEVKKDYSDIIEEPTYDDAMKISQEVLAAFVSGEIGEIYVAYTKFKNTVSQEATLKKLLPVAIEEDEVVQSEEKHVIMNYEPSEEEALELIVPKYITSLIYGGLLESVASENGARMQAMDSATSNAEEMIDKLSLQYNRARQSSITQELTEIIAGAEAIS